MAIHLALASLLAAGSVQAQTNPTAADPQTMAPIVVTAGAQNSTEGSGSYTSSASTAATGLNLSLRDTPQSVSLITRERLDDQALRSVFDVANSAPGVSAKEIDSVRGYFSARGFKIDKLQIDGVPMPGNDAGEAKADTAIYDRVEIVRGATGLMNGTGSPSASINLIRKHADSKTFTGSASLGLGSWGRHDGVLDLSSPLNHDGSVRGRVVVSAEEHDSFIRLERGNSALFYAVVDADLDAATRLSVGASEQRDRHRGNQWSGLPIFYTDGGLTHWDRSATTAADWNRWDTQQRSVFATLEHRLANGWKWQATATRRSNTGDQYLNWISGSLDRNTGQGLDAFLIGYGADQHQTDVNLTAVGPYTLFGRQHELAMGLLHGEYTMRWLSSNASFTPPIGDFRAWTGAYPEPAWDPQQVGSSTHTKQTSAYGVTRLQLTDMLKLIAGARVTNWRRDGDQSLWTDVAYSQRHQGVVTPYAGLVWDLGPQTSLYASYTDTFDPQDYRDRRGVYVEPLKGKSAEAGVKGELLDGKANASFAVFHIKQDNFAIADGTTFVPNTREQAYITIDGATTKGYEMEVSGDLAPGWNASISWTQFTTTDASGKDINTMYPHKLFKLYTKYRLPGAWQKLAIGGGVNWEGRSYTSVTNPGTGNQVDVGQNAYAVASLMARYDISHQLSLQVNVNNLFDKRYYANQLDVFNNITFGAPRNVLGTVRYTF
ncbi:MULTISPECIES: TonB-dependent siderophore receptor [unclassified Janthinobacterium]|uniref:TonB-dependent siderophore receptor n=1 Tax=unclassified Janthinobacterium TaxID=2610881 RepID=UPI0016137AB6|nr:MULTISPECIES: TonB-dependent siderophore receptor [unclassified Janthinobacterium]MBB5382815.1 outer membrane receptor for ferric coprogen and ferric-rhodotorulic acid [Janthinobacterium sp. K2Li3]MBB5384800.1 outer membrane receptor for ferric coprogen and ferric-rhodotorulic acid [Janthinobacterium sp. K2E3]